VDRRQEYITVRPHSSLGFLVIVFKRKYWTNSNLKDGTKSGGRSGSHAVYIHIDTDTFFIDYPDDPFGIVTIHISKIPYSHKGTATEFEIWIF
jgi:hypothetical protein